MRQKYVKHCYKSPTPELARYFNVNYSQCIIMLLKRLHPFGQSPFQMEHINEVHLLIPKYSVLVSVSNNLPARKFGGPIQKPPPVVAKALTSSRIVGTQQPLHPQPCSLLVPWGLFPEGVREDRPHEISEGEARTCQQTRMALTAEISLSGEARQECEGVHACFGSAAQSSLQPLPDQDTCQVSSGDGIAELLAFKSLVFLGN